MNHKQIILGQMSLAKIIIGIIEKLESGKPIKAAYLEI